MAGADGQALSGPADRVTLWLRDQSQEPHKSFGARALFDDATLRVGARDRVALVGPNGSGKTTLLEMIMGLQAPDDGTIERAGDVVVGYLPQETDALRGRDILTEVVSRRRRDVAGRTPPRRPRARTRRGNRPGRARSLLAEFARLQEHFDELGGYTLEAQARRILSGLGFTDADLARPTDSLSGGWLMRVALAKLLLAAPDALLLDEPTNHLDLESMKWLERFLTRLRGRDPARLPRPRLHERARDEGRRDPGREARTRTPATTNRSCSSASSRWQQLDAAARNQAKRDRAHRDVHRAVPLQVVEGAAGAEPHQDARQGRAHRSADSKDRRR